MSAKLAGCIWSAMALSVCLISSDALAVPINYVESNDGELPEFSALPVLAFEIGVNTVSGTMGLGVESNDLDSFAFSVPPNTTLLSAQVEMEDFFLNDGDFVGADWNFGTGDNYSNSPIDLEQVSVNSPGSYVFISLPLGPGNYHLSAIGFTTTGDPAMLGDYTFTFTIVPEPSSVALAVLGLFGTAGLARRQRRGRQFCR
jgi:hypothetical protein